MSTGAAHTRWWQTFEAVFGIPFLIGIALQLAWPIVFENGWFTFVRFLAGPILIISGIVIVLYTRREFRSYQQPTDPGRPTNKLITTGVFAYSRNPLYLGGVCVFVGLALTFYLIWGLILLLPALIACHFILILPEERYLAATFGEDYRIYAATVNRWIGRSQLRNS